MYAESLPVDIPNKLVSQLLPLNIMSEEDNTDLLDENGITEYRSLLGKFAFLQHTRFDLSLPISFYGSFSHAPTVKMMRLLNKSCQYAKSTASSGIEFHFSKESDFVLHAYCDASFGSHLKHAQSGYLIFVNNIPIAWKSVRQRRVCHSTVKAECEAMHSCIDMCILLMYFMSELKFSVDATIFSDSLDLINLLMSDYPKPREKHMIIELKRMQRKLNLVDKEINKLVNPLLSLSDLFVFYEKNPISLRHIRGENNIADAFTKPLDVNILRRYLVSNLAISMNNVEFNVKIDAEILDDINEVNEDYDEFSLDCKYDYKRIAPVYVQKLVAKQPSVQRIIRTRNIPKRLTYGENFKQIA